MQWPRQEAARELRRGTTARALCPTHGIPYAGPELEYVLVRWFRAADRICFRGMYIDVVSPICRRFFGPPDRRYPGLHIVHF